MAPQECLITTRGNKKKERKKSGQLRKGRPQRGRQRESIDAFWFRERQETFGELCVRTFVCLRTFYSQLGNVHHVYCPNIESEQSGKYTPFPRERHRSAAELILCGHSSGTWSFHSSLLPSPPHFFFLLDGVQQVMQKKSGEHARVGEVTGVRECGRWEIDFMYV